MSPHLMVGITQLFPTFTVTEPSLCGKSITNLLLNHGTSQMEPIMETVVCKKSVSSPGLLSHLWNARSSNRISGTTLTSTSDKVLLRHHLSSSRHQKSTDQVD